MIVRTLAASAALCLALSTPALAAYPGDTHPERAQQLDCVQVAAMPVTRLPKRHHTKVHRLKIEATVNGKKFHGVGTLKIERRNLEDRPPVKQDDFRPSKPKAPDANLVQKAKAYLGKTARQVGVRSTLWCSAFLRKITGLEGVDDTARSWLSRPRTQPKVGAIVVLTRKGGGHVGILVGFDKRHNPILLSGNHSRRVGIGTYPKGRVLAYVSA